MTHEFEDDGMRHAGLVPTWQERKAELSGSLKRSEVDSMNRLRVEALLERDAMEHQVEAWKEIAHERLLRYITAENNERDLRKALADAVSSMAAAIRILSDTGMDHSDRVYEARAYLRNRIEVAGVDDARNSSDIVCAVDSCLTPKGCSLFGCAMADPEPADDRTPRQARDGTDI